MAFAVTVMYSGEIAVVPQQQQLAVEVVDESLERLVVVRTVLVPCWAGIVVARTARVLGEEQQPVGEEPCLVQLVLGIQG